MGLLTEYRVTREKRDKIALVSKYICIIIVSVSHEPFLKLSLYLQRETPMRQKRFYVLVWDFWLDTRRNQEELIKFSKLNYPNPFSLNLLVPEGNSHCDKNDLCKEGLKFSSCDKIKVISAWCESHLMSTLQNSLLQNKRFLRIL